MHAVFAKTHRLLGYFVMHDCLVVRSWIVETSTDSNKLGVAVSWRKSRKLELNASFGLRSVTRASSRRR